MGSARSTRPWTRGSVSCSRVSRGDDGARVHAAPMRPQNGRAEPTEAILERGGWLVRGAGPGKTGVRTWLLRTAWRTARRLLPEQARTAVAGEYRGRRGYRGCSSPMWTGRRLEVPGSARARFIRPGQPEWARATGLGRGGRPGRRLRGDRGSRPRARRPRHRRAGRGRGRADREAIGEPAPRAFRTSRSSGRTRHPAGVCTRSALA